MSHREALGIRYRGLLQAICRSLPLRDREHVPARDYYPSRSQYVTSFRRRSLGASQVRYKKVSPRSAGVAGRHQSRFIFSALANHFLICHGIFAFQRCFATERSTWRSSTIHEPNRPSLA